MRGASLVNYLHEILAYFVDISWAGQVKSVITCICNDVNFIYNRSALDMILGNVPHECQRRVGYSEYK